MNFYFNQLFSQALDGIDAQSLSQATVQLGGVILIASLLYAVYEAYSNGGDVRQLAVAGVKYLILGLILNSYQTIFRSVNVAFDGIADFMFNLSGVGDVGQAWLNSLSSALGTQNGIEAFFGLVTGNASAALGALIMGWGTTSSPFTYTIFTISYVLYGSILYVVGPLVLALIPTRTLGRLATTYAVNLMIFQSWSLLYAILQVLMSAIHINDLQVLANNGSFLNGFVGANSILLMGIASFVLSLCIALIPFLARHIISGDIGQYFVAGSGHHDQSAGMITSAAFGIGGSGGASRTSGAVADGSAGGGGIAGTPPVPPINRWRRPDSAAASASSSGSGGSTKLPVTVEPSTRAAFSGRRLDAQRPMVQRGHAASEN